jgi:hypothetical protein
MTQTPILQQLDKQKLNMFATMDSLPEALKAFREHLPDIPTGRWVTPMYIYHNSLIEELKKTLIIPETQESKPGVVLDEDLMDAIVWAFNMLPNARIERGGYKDTYALASALGKAQRAVA